MSLAIIPLLSFAVRRGRATRFEEVGGMYSLVVSRGVVIEDTLSWGEHRLCYKDILHDFFSSSILIYEGGLKFRGGINIW